MACGPVNAFQMNQYVIACTETKKAAIVDCGASTQNDLDAFLKWMDEKQYELTAVWQTHAHLDHVAGLGLLYAVHPDIPIYLHEREKQIYNSFNQRRKEFGFPVEGDGDLPDDTKLTYFEEGLKSLSLGNLCFEILQTPGHSPGHVGFLEPTTKSFFGGDFIMQASVGRTDFPTSNPKDMHQSLERFLETVDEDTIIYPGHGSPTTLKHEKEFNPFLQEFK